MKLRLLVRARTQAALAELPGKARPVDVVALQRCVEDVKVSAEVARCIGFLEGIAGASGYPFEGPAPVADSPGSWLLALGLGLIPAIT